MDKFVISGGNKLCGEIKVSGAKNVAMKVILTGLLTNQPIYVSNIPLIDSVYGSAKILNSLGVKFKFNSKHELKILGDNKGNFMVPLEEGNLYRTATMVIGPLLARYGQAIVPNPGGCRIGKRPIDWHITALESMGAKIKYKDGYFYAQANHLHGTKYKFNKNTHTGTETMILAAVLADGETLIENAAAEPEIDNLIELLDLMGAKIKRIKPRTIVISGVKNLNGAEFEIMPDRNEVVTYAVAALATGGDILIKGAKKEHLSAFLDKLTEINASYVILDNETIRFNNTNKNIKSTNLETKNHPGFMTDWQAPWALLMTQAKGTSVLHETIYEDRFSYVKELLKMGANIRGFNPKITHPEYFYNFNWTDRTKYQYHAIKVRGPKKLHNAILEVTDLRAGATLVIGALIAKGKSIIIGIEHIERGYEKIDEKLNKLGANIRRIHD